jgi:hypothetical protein
VIYPDIRAAPRPLRHAAFWLSWCPLHLIRSINIIFIAQLCASAPAGCSLWPLLQQQNEHSCHCTRSHSQKSTQKLSHTGAHVSTHNITHTRNTTHTHVPIEVTRALTHHTHISNTHRTRARTHTYNAHAPCLCKQQMHNTYIQTTHTPHTCTSHIHHTHTHTQAHTHTHLHTHTHTDNTHNTHTHKTYTAHFIDDRTHLFGERPKAQHRQNDR